MIYIHKDVIYETIGGSWYYTIAHYLRKKRVPYKVVNGHNVDEVTSLNPTKDDMFIGRFAHDELDKKLSKQTLPIIWDKFDKVFPSKKSYHFYDNKKRQYKFMLENNIPCLETYSVKNKKDLSNLKIKYPIVLKKSWGAGSEQVNYFDRFEDVIDNKKNRGWTLKSIYPTLAQEYQDVKYDYKILLFDSKFVIYKRLMNWKNGNKDNFPYGTEPNTREDILKLRKPPFKDIKMYDAFDDVDEDFMKLIKKLLKIQKEKLDTYFMGWDLLKTKDGYKVLEFSVVNEIMIPNLKFFDLSKKEIIKYPSKKHFGNREKRIVGIKNLINEYIK